MKEILKLLNELKFRIKDLHKELISKEIDMEIALFDMIECLSFIQGYAEHKLETKNPENF